MGKIQSTKEPQYDALVELKKRKGLTRLGIMNNQVWNDDPKRLVFTLSRYKFVAKMLTGKERVLEVGCGDAFCSRIVMQEVQNLTVTDFDPVFITDIKERMDPDWAMEYSEHNMLESPFPKRFDAIYSLDVLEHIHPSDEDQFLANLALSLHDHGVLIIGMPSLESQTYASEQSKIGHVNCKTGNEFRKIMGKYFHNVFIFAMNDEVVHTGFLKMAHYLIALCTEKKNGEVATTG